jgi:hypothetical protein
MWRKNAVYSAQCDLVGNVEPGGEVMDVRLRALVAYQSSNKKHEVGIDVSIFKNHPLMASDCQIETKTKHPSI